MEAAMAGGRAAVPELEVDCADEEAVAAVTLTLGLNNNTHNRLKTFTYLLIMGLQGFKNERDPLWREYT